MNKINKDELYKNLTDFLKAKGVEVKNGSYPDAIRQGCSILADTINLTQKALGRAKVQVDKTLEQMRKTVHEKTAPKAPPCQAAPSPPAGERPPAADAAAAAAPQPEKAAPSGQAPTPPAAAEAPKPKAKPRPKPAPRKTKKRPARTA
jgi:hypothetical protein